MKTGELVTIQWRLEDERGPMGEVENGGRKLVRLDRFVPGHLRPGNHTLQPCRVTRDTAPDNAGRGVLFVTPIGPAEDVTKVHETRAAQRLQEVRAEWEISWRKAATEGGENLRVAIGGFDPEGASTYNSRWGENAPRHCRLKVVSGRAGVWTRTWKDGVFSEGENILPLPELGEGAELSRRLAENWYVSSRPEATQRLKELELTAEDVCRSVRSDREGYLAVSWEATVGGQRIKFAGTSTSVPDFEHHFGDEEIPELNAAYAAWAEKELARESDELLSGTVTTGGYVTPTYDYVSPDERGTRTGGGDSVITVKVDGVEVGSVLRVNWARAVEHLGLVEGGFHPGLSPRMFRAVNLAYTDMWTFGKLGPRGRFAVMNAAGVTFDPALVKVAAEEGVRLQKEAKQAAEEAARKAVLEEERTRRATERAERAHEREIAQTETARSFARVMETSPVAAEPAPIEAKVLTTFTMKSERHFTCGECGKLAKMEVAQWNRYKNTGFGSITCVCGAEGEANRNALTASAQKPAAPPPASAPVQPKASGGLDLSGLAGKWGKK